MHPRRKTVQFKRQVPRVKDRMTEELLNQITHSASPESFLGVDPGVERDLPAYLSQMLEEKGMRKSEVIRTAGLNETFGYQIFSGQRGASRDKVISIGFALGLNLQEMQRLLYNADKASLYSKNRRDAIIIFCASHGYSLMKTDEELYRFGEETISDGG
jgi:cyanate lyase